MIGGGGGGGSVAAKMTMTDGVPTGEACSWK